MTRDSVVIADLTYNIADFQKGEYFVLAQVETKETDRTTDGDFPDEDYPEIDRPAGQISFTFPMKYVWDHDEVKRPFTVWFYLNKRTGPKTSSIAASTTPVHYEVR